MAYEIKQNVVDPVRVGFDWVERRLGRPANRYEEGSIEVQQEENFHYRPLWDPEHEIFDRSYTALDVGDPYNFLDPRQYYYYTYNQARNKAAEHQQSTLSYAEEFNAFASLPEDLIKVFAETLTPLRHLEYGMQMVMVQMSAFAWGTTIEQAAIYSGFDHLGNAQQLSKLALQFENGVEILDEAKTQWMEREALQPLRRYIEDVLVLSDWGEQFVAVSAVLSPLMYPSLYRGLETQGVGLGEGLSMSTLRYFYDWYLDDQKWVRSFISHLLSVENSSNQEFLRTAFEKWSPGAELALRTLLDDLPDSLDSSEMMAQGISELQVVEELIGGRV
ncbi:Phenol hydroxylase P1 protein [Ferrithrix thermotolerans DSM 19514]|jgi:phenol hydroxylase P1 protein|uniref:propane 2-monooxygenase n=1 Tax=Ferrithrix thermotolerans DSM 19514 TaxID=1121881 RepID=A0A1M4V330_9ACTN|nr:phenol 2-monooxygenase [Ferrithrix thermotolerans]SHE63298.1 Phenol hydroxylase P1 protein [Ferrithrix thermotolerans DSM 19514]